MISLMCFFLVGALLFWCFDWVGWLGSFFFLGHCWVSMPFQVLVDNVSSVCSFMLVCCGFIALFYCYHYFPSGRDGNLLFLLMVWFLFVMLFLIFSFSLIFSLVLWEYLGLVSFFLILFYSNMVSLRASLVTLFASRFGDVSLFVLVFAGLSYCDVSGVLICFLLLLVVLTKSASYPFISWLMEAMRAPTPVSSLVHSSTLVAAGVWFLLRYSYVFDSSVLSMLFLFCLVTVFLSGASAVFFVDLKKVVALSTCKNISWCVLFFVCGDQSLALLQLLTHGVCKCYLFMSVGDVMAGSLGSQDSKVVYLHRYGGFYGSLLQFVLMFSLAGIPFLGVFFGKHGLFSLVFYSFSPPFLFLLLLCFFLSYVYSVRLCLMLWGDSVGMFFGYLSKFYFVWALVMLATFLNYLGTGLFLESCGLSVWSSLLMLFVQSFGCFVGWLFWYYNVSWLSAVSWCSSLWGGDYIVSWFYALFKGFSSFFILGLYRWEVLSMSFFYNSFSLGLRGGVSSSILSINFMVGGLLLLLVLDFVFFC